MTSTFIPERPLADGRARRQVDVDDAFEAVVRVRERRGGHAGSLALLPRAQEPRGVRDQRLERLDPLQPGALQRAGGLLDRDAASRAREGFTNVLVTESYHPFWSNWWPQGHIIGWEHTFVHEIAHLLDAIVNNKDVAPLRRDVRGRLPQRRDLRRHPAIRPGGPAGGYRLLGAGGWGSEGWYFRHQPPTLHPQPQRRNYERASNRYQHAAMCPGHHRRASSS